MYTLYYSPGSASMAVHAALIEAGVPYDLEMLDFQHGEQRTSAYLRLNPQGTVPTLLIDGKPAFESAALLMTLAERHPQADLAPGPGSPLRPAWHQWMVYLSNNLGATFRFWFYPSDLGADEHPDAVRRALQQKIEAAWECLDGELSANGPYLLGERFSTADLLLAMYMRWSRNMPRPATSWPALDRLALLVRQRPSWKRMTELEGLTDWTLMA
ncbi:glutathione S-transferase family protein [Noviherbaspirillum aerium]|uniref:glutathione S-transferase family protein n=1 Tax=Noviherbaspirillum aerium TaxID=2588497 RepID=UPI00124EEE94|nr:glutathione S-transferase family protein [Noviherbaspirillum aerium]